MGGRKKVLPSELEGRRNNVQKAMNNIKPPGKPKDIITDDEEAPNLEAEELEEPAKKNTRNKKTREQKVLEEPAEKSRAQQLSELRETLEQNVNEPNFGFGHDNGGVSSLELQEFIAIRELLLRGDKDHDLYMRSDLNELQITVYAQALTWSKEEDLPIIKEFVENKLALAVSKGRKGRTEFVKALQSARGNDDNNGLGSPSLSQQLGIR